MRRTAAILSFLMAVVLFAIVITGLVNDSKASSERLDAGFRDLERHDYAAIDRRGEEIRAEGQAEALEGIGGAIFLIAGFALWPRRKVRVGAE